MEIPVIYGWNMPLVVANRDEMYGGIHGSSCHPWKFLLSMEVGLPFMDGRKIHGSWPSIHGWKEDPWMAESMGGMHHTAHILFHT